MILVSGFTITYAYWAVQCYIHRHNPIGMKAKLETTVGC